MAMGSVGNTKKCQSRSLPEQRCMNTEVHEDPVLGAQIHRRGAGKPQHLLTLGLSVCPQHPLLPSARAGTLPQQTRNALLLLFCVSRQVTEVLHTYSLAI